MNSNTETTYDAEREAAELARTANTVAHLLAARAAGDDRYDQLAALSAAAHAVEATTYLPPAGSPVNEGGSDRTDPPEVERLAEQLEKAAADLDALARRSQDLRQVRDRYSAALHCRNAAAALRTALPIGEGVDG